MATWDLRRLQQALDKKDPAPLYLLYGEEFFLVSESLKLLKAKAVDEASADFNFDQFSASENTAAEVRDTAEMLPMMAKRRVVIFKEVDRLKEKDWEVLMPLLENPFDSCTLILVAEKIDKRKKIFKKIDAKGVVVELKRPYDNQVPVWIDYIAHQRGIKINSEASRLIHQLVGTSLSEIDSEMAKLAQFVGDREAKVEDVLKVVSQSRIDSVFDLTDAIGRRDRAAALVCLANLLEHGQNEVGSLALIARHVRILASIKEGVKRGLAGGQLASKAGVPQFFLKQYMGQCSIWGEEHIRNTMNALYETDKALKSSPLSSHIWLENFIIQTC